MSDAEKMWDALNCLPDVVEHFVHGDPDDADSVTASAAVKWAIDEITRFREERRIVAWGVQFPDGQVIAREKQQDAEWLAALAARHGPADAFRLVALSIEPMPPETKQDEVSK
jgi:hypothetical protein